MWLVGVSIVASFSPESRLTSPVLELQAMPVSREQGGNRLLLLAAEFGPVTGHLAIPGDSPQPI